MRVKAKPDFADSQSICEYVVASARRRCVYPGIIQCVSLTGLRPDAGLLGTHISPGASQEEIDKTFEILITGGAANCTKWYLVGNFQQHYQYTKVGWTSQQKIAKAMRQHFGKQPSYYSIDTSELVKELGYSWGIDIYADFNTTEVVFSQTKAASRSTLPPTPIPIAPSEI